MEKRKIEEGKIAPQMFAALSGTIILMEAGFHMGWASPTLPKLLKDPFIPMTLVQTSWIVSLMSFGSLAGPLVSVAIVDRWGRKTSMLLTSIPFLLSCTLIAFAQNYWWYYVGRVVCGMGLGAVFTIVPIYLGEIASDRIRGGFGILMSVMLNTGYLLSLCAGPWMSTPLFTGLGAIIPILYVLTFVWMPEAPHYCIMKNDPDGARKSLEWLRGTTNVDEEIEGVRKTVEFDLKNAGTLRELFTDKGNQKALLISIGLLSAQQISGTIAILSYTTIIFNEVSSGISSSVSVIITGVVQLVVAILLFFVADKAGRRTFLLLSMFSSSIFLIGEAVYFHLKANGNDVSGISWLPVTAIVGYLCGYTLGLGTLPMALISEIFPCNVKAYATMVSTIYLSLAAACVSQFYPMVANAYGIHVAFYIFAVGTIFSMVLTYLYLPETKGKSLEAIQDILQGRSESKLRLQEVSAPNYGTNNSLASIATIDIPDGRTVKLK